MKTNTIVTTQTEITITSEEIERIIKMHLECGMQATVQFDVSSGGMLRGATVTTVTTNNK